jgi:chromosome condensin MukBEF MukE localization factor
MLSKALQKANTAVLLDNAANFEGAIEAYQDACQLLQLVMVRSSGSDDEKSKLQEIVSGLLFCKPSLLRYVC